jgi:hypothetical protein
LTQENIPVVRRINLLAFTGAALQATRFTTSQPRFGALSDKDKEQARMIAKSGASEIEILDQVSEEDDEETRKILRYALALMKSPN